MFVWLYVLDDGSFQGNAGDAEIVTGGFLVSFWFVLWVVAGVVVLARNFEARMPGKFGFCSSRVRAIGRKGGAQM